MTIGGTNMIDIYKWLVDYYNTDKKDPVMTGKYLALAESRLDHTTEALKDLDLAKIEYDGSYHHLHVNHGDRLVNRAVVLAHAGRVAEARRNCAEGLQILGQFLKPDEAFYKSNVAICARI